LRMKERENKTIVTSEHYLPLPARMAPRPSLAFPRYLLQGRPTKYPGAQRGPDALEHGGRMQSSQLNNNLQF
jgi:hypothetical protein